MSSLGPALWTYFSAISFALPNQACDEKGPASQLTANVTSKRSVQIWHALAAANMSRGPLCWGSKNHIVRKPLAGMKYWAGKSLGPSSVVNTMTGISFLKLGISYRVPFVCVFWMQIRTRLTSTPSGASGPAGRLSAT
eukprot:3178100-Pyramimonas_sp.AAC.1